MIIVLLIISIVNCSAQQNKTSFHFNVAATGMNYVDSYGFGFAGSVGVKIGGSTFSIHNSFTTSRSWYLYEICGIQHDIAFVKNKTTSIFMTNGIVPMTTFTAGIGSKFGVTNANKRSIYSGIGFKHRLTNGLMTTIVIRTNVIECETINRETSTKSQSTILIPGIFIGIGK